MLNFTVGPVMSDPEIIKIANTSTPYFRTPEFSKTMLENESFMLEFLNAPNDSRVIFLTVSGTGSMESVVLNLLTDEDKVMVINGGTFGHRFVELCRLHHRNFSEVKCEFGRQLRIDQLVGLEDYTALLINMHETSSGLLYNMKMVSRFCKDNDILLIVDAISSFIADELDMNALGADAVIIGSQKALAVQPGISMIALSPRAIKRVENNNEICMYLSLKQALQNGKRGQTPFTPAVTTLLQINARLHQIYNRGGVGQERDKIISLAGYFRNSIKNLPFEFVSESPSNAVTCLRPLHGDASKIVNILKDTYKIWVCPNGGEMADVVFRVGHIGFITRENNQTLIDAMYDMNKKGLL